MNIRLANKFDLPYIMKMLKHFSEQTPIEMMRDSYKEEYLSTLYRHILLGGGLALVAESDEPIGMIIGIKHENVWDPNLIVLRELVYWVEPEYRNTRAGYKLLKEYNKQAEMLIKDGKIKLYTMTKMVNSPDIDFSRFGYTKTEEVWVAGA